MPVMDIKKKSAATENGSACNHSHSHSHVRNRKKPPVEVEDVFAPSPIKEETEQEIEETLVKESDRPLTGVSGGRKSQFSNPLPNSRPNTSNRRPTSRPESSRSVFEHIPGTRPASRRTISRTSSRSRKSRPDSTGSRAFNKDHSSDSDSDEERKQKDVLFETDYNAVDIHDEKAFDTDLEVEAKPRLPHIVDGVLDFQSVRLAYCTEAGIKTGETDINLKGHFLDGSYGEKMHDARQQIAHLLTADQTTSYDHTGKTSYIEGCKKLGVVPASYYLRHMGDKQLSMRHHGLGSAGMKAVAVSLLSNTNVLDLDLSDNWLGIHGGLAVCEMLRENCFITTLNLSDNRLGNECASHLSQILQQNVTLTHVSVAGNEFDDNAAVHFAEAIMNTTKVQYLNLSHNCFGESSGIVLGPAIADNTCIKELDLSWNCLRRKGAVAVAQGLKNNVYMKKVNLSWNGFGLEGSIGLQDCLKGNSVLEELDITNNRITTEGAVIIGKGVSLNETLKVLKVGKNPLQSAGCYGLCAAILRNPNCVLQELDFSDVLVNNDFNDVLKQVFEMIPNMKIKHGGQEPPQKPKAKVHPMVKLAHYIEKHDLRLIDFFNKFDKDGSMSVTHEEFVEGIECARMAILTHAKETGIKLSEEEITLLLDELDRDGDGEINYNELVAGHLEFQEKKEKINTVLTVMQPRPMTT